MGRYLIAGAAGYVGSRLAQRLLQQGHWVRGLVRDPEQETVQRLAGLGMAVWQGDLTQPESLVGVANGVEAVYNLTSRSVLDTGSVRGLFVEGNRHLIAVCARARTVRAYVFTGHAAAYGDQGDAWVGEDTPAAPAFPLAQVLAETEQAILALVQEHHFPAILLRVGSIYGPERDFVEAVRSNTAMLIGDGRNFITHIHIDDLLDVLQRLAHDGQPGAIYNVCDDEPVRSAEFYGVIRQHLGMLPPRAIARDTALAAGLDPNVVGMASSSARMSNQRLKDELGLRLRYPSFRTWLDTRVEAPSDLEQATAIGD